MANKIFLDATPRDPLLEVVGNPIRPIQTATGLKLGTETISRIFDITYQDHPDDKTITLVTLRAQTPIVIDGYARNLQYLRERYIKEVPFTNHLSFVKKPENISKTQTLNMGPDISSYEITPRFNYISEKYSEAAELYNENELPAIWDVNVVVEDFQNPTRYPWGSTPQQPIIIPKSQPNGMNFPYYNQITIANKVTNRFSNSLEKIDISANFLDGYITSVNKPLVSFYTQDGSGQAILEAIPTWNVLTWLTDVPGQDSSLFSPDPYSPVPMVDSQTLMNLKKDLFRAIVNDIGNDNLRSYQDLVEQKSCYYEDYAYMIKKYKEEATGDPVQIFLSRASTDRTRLLDTQVKYGHKYVYQASGHYVIVGNVYNYTKIEVHNENTPDPRITLEVHNTPSIVIVPMNLFTQPVMVIQPPPVYPKVKFMTQLNSSREIHMHFSPTQGHLYDDFDVITEEDKNQLEQMTLSVPPTQLQDGFRFETFNESGLYEIFRMTTPPNRLTDFATHKINEIRMPYESENAICTDYVAPNTKYYYLFRKVNAHDVVSNPTSIYEVELVVDADDSKVVVNDYEIPLQPNSQKYRTFKSLFQIKPAVEHTIFDNTQPALFNIDTLAGTLDDLSLGVADKPVWTRKFKFRIKSTTSGKIIDYNITFNLSRDKTEEDF